MSSSFVKDDKGGVVQEAQCIVIGAGPSGLSIGYHLKKKGVEFLMLDKGATGHSWNHMQDKLVLVGPWWVNRLTGSWINPLKLFGNIRRQDFLMYLKRYADCHSLPIQGDTFVKAIRYEAPYYYLKTDHGELRAKTIVCATGYYSNPKIPEFTAQNDQSVPMIHAFDYRNPKKIAEQFPGCKNIVIVGKKITAGQLLEELTDYGYNVDLSIRGEFDVRNSNPLVIELKKRIYFFWEAVRIRFQPHLKAVSYPVMEDGRARNWIAAGQVKLWPLFKEIDNKHLIFEDGSKTPCDLVIFATGYHPVLDYLDSLVPQNPKDIPDSMESRDYPGLFFLGFDNIVNFRSRYIRGIRSDVKALANKIAVFLK